MTPGGAQADVRDAPAAAVAEVVNPAGTGRFVLACEHASNYIPPEMGGLGLNDGALQSHIAWDPGALDVAREMARRLDSPLAVQRVSRLVYDCNRAPLAAGAIPESSEIYRIPGNAGLSVVQRMRRERLFYEPFRAALAGVLDGRTAQFPVVLTVHSFSPVYAGMRRDMDMGLIDHGDDRFALAMLGAMRERTRLVVRRNAPYCREDGVTHTLALHAVARGLLNVMIEVRNDLLAASEDRRAMAVLLADCALAALASLEKVE
ncbi:MAG: N-formylglutamate amidohydrolase [Gammaproteobacteria bacterium]